jgi:hypothetical protein
MSACHEALLTWQKRRREKLVPAVVAEVWSLTQLFYSLHLHTSLTIF